MKWKPSTAEAAEYAQKMQEIDAFCETNNISRSPRSDSYYFTINGIKYRVSNHTVEASNRRAFDAETGQQIRDMYHDGREQDTVYIHAGKTRLVEIYTALSNGLQLDSRGRLIS